MFSDPVSFNGGTRVEVITVLANCGRDTDRARRALVTWIRHKQDKNRSTEHILTKLRDIESKFIKDTTLHGAFRDARAETCLPRAPDLPLPSHIGRKSAEHASGPAPSIITPDSPGRGSLSSSVVELPANMTRRTSPSISPLRLSRDSSQISEISPVKSNPRQRISLPQGVPRVPPSHSPRIQIPHDRSRPGPNSPITSSPEEPEVHFRFRSMSQPTGPSAQSNGLMTPVSDTTSEYPISHSRDQHVDFHRRLSHCPPPSTRIQIPRSRSQRSFPHSPPTSSSDDSDFHPRRYRPLSQPVGAMSPSFRRLTPPRTCPPDVPLPPIPSDDQGVDSDDNSRRSFPAELPPTPARSSAFFASTPIRPLPIQPIPSPVPGSDEYDTIGEDSLRPNWHASNSDLPSDIVVRQDSPVYMFHNDCASIIGICPPPPPYADHPCTHSPPDMATITDSLDRTVNECGGSREVRLVVSKCIEFQRGYEPPYWQTRLEACGLDAETARHLVDEMNKEIDWVASFRRST